VLQAVHCGYLPQGVLQGGESSLWTKSNAYNSHYVTLPTGIHRVWTTCGQRRRTLPCALVMLRATDHVCECTCGMRMRAVPPLVHEAVAPQHQHRECSVLW
jgi:hypothetical protein